MSSSNNNKKLKRTKMLIFPAIGLCVNLLPNMACIAGAMCRIGMKGVCFHFKLLPFVWQIRRHTMRCEWDENSNRSSGNNGNEDEASYSYSYSSIYVHFQSASILDFRIFNVRKERIDKWQIVGLLALLWGSQS